MVAPLCTFTAWIVRDRSRPPECDVCPQNPLPWRMLLSVTSAYRLPICECSPKNSHRRSAISFARRYVREMPDRQRRRNRSGMSSIAPSRRNGPLRTFAPVHHRPCSLRSAARSPKHIAKQRSGWYVSSPKRHPFRPPRNCFASVASSGASHDARCVPNPRSLSAESPALRPRARDVHLFEPRCASAIPRLELRGLRALLLPRFRDELRHVLLAESVNVLLLGILCRFHRSSFFSVVVPNGSVSVDPHAGAAVLGEMKRRRLHVGRRATEQRHRGDLCGTVEYLHRPIRPSASTNLIEEFLRHSRQIADDSPSDQSEPTTNPTAGFSSPSSPYVRSITAAGSPARFLPCENPGRPSRTFVVVEPRWLPSSKNRHIAGSYTCHLCAIPCKPYRVHLFFLP